MSVRLEYDRQRQCYIKGRSNDGGGVIGGLTYPPPSENFRLAPSFVGFTVQQAVNTVRTVSRADLWKKKHIYN